MYVCVYIHTYIHNTLFMRAEVKLEIHIHTKFDSIEIIYEVIFMQSLLLKGKLCGAIEPSQ